MALKKVMRSAEGTAVLMDHEYIVLTSRQVSVIFTQDFLPKESNTILNRVATYKSRILHRKDKKLLGLKVCSAARLVPEYKELHIAPPQNSKAELAFEETVENNANNLVEFRFRENRTGGDAEHEFPQLKVQRLSTSESSPAVGHMQVSRGAMKERILGSNPSPGDGN
ncbi:hypothetical protein SUGI_0253920 [Cryptomeria japonica]|nr:hypothetical protein SUGI_0253920 [Cryptomeria japonica]